MANDDAARKEAKEAVEGLVEIYHGIMQQKNFRGYDRYLMDSLRVIEAYPGGGALWELPITDYWTNINEVMHGGAYGVIFDMCTAISMSPISKEGYWEFLAGVTRSLNISYLKAVPIGVTVYIRTKVIQHGRTMALIGATMESKDGKIIYATAEHHKVHTPALPEYSQRFREWLQRKEKSKI
ncbi:hypothetical protein ACJ73_08103 [Blastomyces percursus]|uniref:Thioesterase domain-containing protein n=1 Tax=Blastomyces percursus TaxID=1658174 RepID=A0A1J9PXC6_9EURO|nr:hypothetical protein ACJ73_08103 [Blastomyces percursus]